VADDIINDELAEIPAEYAVLSETAFKKAKVEGWDVVLPSKTELFIDIDDEQGAAKFDELFPIFLEFRPNAVVVRRTPSPSGKPGRYHIVVDTNSNSKLTDLERITLQAALGSDRKRELLGWQRVELGDKNPTLFFEKPAVVVPTIDGTKIDDDIPF